MSIPIVTIGSISEQIRGVSYSKTDASDIRLEGYLPILRAGNITESGLTFDDLVFVPSGKISNTQKIKKNDILIAASSGSLSVVGKAARALDDFNGGFGAFCKVLRPNAKVDPAYFANYFFTSEYRRKISSVAAGANINNLRNSDIDDLEIPLPPLAEQKRIAAILDKADAIRRKRQQAIELADEFLRSVFLDMFGDPVTNPKGWDKTSVNELIKKGKVLSVQDGNHGNDHPKVSDFIESGFPFVTANVVRDGKILFDKCYYLDKSWLKKLRIGFARPRDILITHKGTLGLTAVLDDTYETYIFSPQTTYFRLNENAVTPEFLKGFFDTNYFQEQFKKEGIQSTRAYLGITRQKELEILIPPIELQREFAKRVEKVEALKAKLKASQLQAEEQFKALSQRAFAGEL